MIDKKKIHMRPQCHQRYHAFNRSLTKEAIESNCNIAYETGLVFNYEISMKFATDLNEAMLRKRFEVQLFMLLEAV